MKAKIDVVTKERMKEHNGYGFEVKETKLSKENMVEDVQYLANSSFQIHCRVLQFTLVTGILAFLLLLPK